MQKKKIILLLLLTACLLATHSALAGSSTNYRVDWLQPMVGSAGAATSTNYAVSVTIGQTSIGSTSSTHYSQGLGYWYGYYQTVWRLLLPMLRKP